MRSHQAPVRGQEGEGHVNQGADENPDGEAMGEDEEAEADAAEGEPEEGFFSALRFSMARTRQ
jgi:hypothetical protein